MTIGAAVSPLLRTMRDLDCRWQRARRPDRRSVLFDARTAMEYGMMAPVLRRLRDDARVRTALISSTHPERAREIFREAPPDVPVLSPRAAMMQRFDACVAANLVWATLPRRAPRVQMFHGVSGKFSREYDRPDTSMRQWDRLFFINRRRLQNYVASGAIDRDSPAIRLVGMPKSDCLVDGSITRAGVLAANGIDPAATTVLYAPTWTQFSSLNAMGEALVAGLVDAGYCVLVKLHDLSLDPAVVNSGGVDWIARLTPILAKGNGHIIRSADASPWLVASDVLITDHSSIGFEYLLLDRPLIRIAMPELIARADIGTEYVELMRAVSTTVENAAAAIAAVGRALADPGDLAKARRALALELFHDPGRATEHASRELYELMELEPAAWLTPAVHAPAMVGAPERALSRS
ncbi:MAG TPA: CDP-glycerol glycerophosphotransferase family protein [Vicinamibacterales bacterium]|nr:CDP-glycerol glycerophosphotransferase family protein [Vicinamibacterales bacterium]